MSSAAIRADGLGKRYRLGEHQSYGSIRESLMSRLASIVRRRQHTQPASIWALRDISFQIDHGEAVGIIGRNGAGKSTLLKVLSRITEPTAGRAWINGRVGSLLEVGTGFHPELTGRENVFLNGAILGMRKREIEARFDEMVAFAEIESFLDTPVKRYSSGMYLRLAFAVAAHLEPEILLVDEVLAVGDIAFQRKCLGKMGEVAQGGRTVLFVSHNMEAIQRLCDRAIRIDDGRVAGDGRSSEIVREFLGGSGGSEDSRPVFQQGTVVAEVRSHINGQKVPRHVLWDLGQTLTISITCHTKRPTQHLLADLTVYRMDGLRMFSASAELHPTMSVETSQLDSHVGVIDIKCPAMARGDFYLDIGVRQSQGPYEVLWNHAATISTTGGGASPRVAKSSLVVPEVTLSLDDPQCARGGENR